MRIKKVINNSILCAVDEKGSELIATGKEIGFQRRRGEELDPALIERTCRMEEKTEQRKLLDLAETISLEYLSLSEELTSHFKTQIPQPQWSFDREFLDFSRFVVYLRYFAQRLFQDKLMSDVRDEQDAVFQQLIQKSCKQHYGCARRIGDYIRSTYQKELSEEELIYLTIHLKRINLDSRS